MGNSLSYLDNLLEGIKALSNSYVLTRMMNDPPVQNR